MQAAAFSIAIVGAGPVGLALALQAAGALPQASIAVFDKRVAAQDVAGDPRTLALSLGSVQQLERLGAWPRIEPRACAIGAVHVSQRQPSMLASFAATLGVAKPANAVRITAADCGVELLGAVASYGAIVAPLQAAWLDAVAREPQRLAARFGQAVAALKPLARGVEIDAGIAERFDLAVVAEGGVFSAQGAKSLDTSGRRTLRHDYRQTAWVGQVTLDRVAADEPGTAYERFTPHGPAALLPLPGDEGGRARAALVWCVDAADDPVRSLDAAQRLAVLNSLFPAEAGRIVAVSALKDFALGLDAQRSLVDAGAPIVRIGNAAQTLHPVAGQGLNLGLRDAHALVEALADAARALRSTTGPIDLRSALARVERERAPDRWALIAATDFLARSFTWQLPGLASARGLGLLALQSFGPAKRALAQRMMFGLR
ncbi:MAG TPA: FAD-dependent monooxygenase [Methylibium sp.]|uniref:FAD-dependent monooxygenase n=1 Tax=Methylibium sp. TaxID=2067992 RepID=UPI002DBCF31D|nr:FAD-dependent monooxygenase [Methylibium sp.]HEU4460434.1 FAD-dependent monooxygenase [Methylibium sp.]